MAESGFFSVLQTAVLRNLLTGTRCLNPAPHSLSDSVSSEVCS